MTNKDLEEVILLAFILDEHKLFHEADNIHSLIKQACNVRIAGPYSPPAGIFNTPVDLDGIGTNRGWLYDADNDGDGVELHDNQLTDTYYYKSRHMPRDTALLNEDSDDTDSTSPMEMHSGEGEKAMPGVANISPLSTPSMRYKSTDDMPTMDEQHMEDAPYQRYLLE